jgi:signal transduction histidine kinase
MQHQEPRHNRSAALRVTSRPLGSPPDPADGPFAIERLTTLGHELNNLLDGSMRCLGLARRSLGLAQAGGEQVERARQQLETVYAALERMSDLVHAAMQGSASLIGSPTLNPKPPITIGEAVSHAIDVLTPEADELGIVMSLECAAGAEQIAVGPLYSVVLNALRNALESISRAGPDASGCVGGHVDVRVSAQPVPGADVDLLLIEIADDGHGLASPKQAVQAFDLGYSTKPGGLGVGLALAREVVREVGGSIDLRHRPDRINCSRPGAILKITYPVVRPKG